MNKMKNSNCLFCFNDLLNFDDSDIKIILDRIEIHQLAKALKDSTKELQDKFFHNMNEHDLSMLKEDIEWFESIKQIDVKAAQEEIKKVVLQLRQR